MKTNIPSLLMSSLLLTAACGMPPAPGEEAGQPTEVHGQYEGAVVASDSGPVFQDALEGLAKCYATALDAIGAGDVAGGTSQLDGCFTPDADVFFRFPPRYQALNADLHGTAALGQFAAGAYQYLSIVRTQHNVGNFVATRTGGDTATLRSYISGVHAHPDESVLNITGIIDDEVRRMPDGQWRITRRQVNGTSLTVWPAAQL